MADVQSKTADEIFTGLDNVLDQEKAALLAGDLKAISDLMEEKSQLIAELNALGASEGGDLDVLKEKADRNQVLLGSALEGIRRVADRLADMQTLRHSFDTYDKSGRRQTIEGEVARQVEKRA